jgi:hypothetical protein
MPIEIDWEGLVVAFENRSRQITHFFDRDTGDVVQCVEARDPERHRRLVADRRFLALPKDRGERSEGDMREFLAMVERPELRRELERALASEDPSLAYRDALRASAADEQRFFAFKQQRARERAETWLASMDIPFQKRSEPVKAPREFPDGAPGGPRRR